MQQKLKLCATKSLCNIKKKKILDSRWYSPLVWTNFCLFRCWWCRCELLSSERKNAFSIVASRSPPLFFFYHHSYYYHVFISLFGLHKFMVHNEWRVLRVHTTLKLYSRAKCKHCSGFFSCRREQKKWIENSEKRNWMWWRWTPRRTSHRRSEDCSFLTQCDGREIIHALQQLQKNIISRQKMTESRQLPTIFFFRRFDDASDFQALLFSLFRWRSKAVGLKRTKYNFNIYLIYFRRVSHMDYPRHYPQKSEFNVQRA